MKKEEYKEILNTGWCLIRFKKADGSIRDSVATLSSNNLPVIDESKVRTFTKAQNEEVINFYTDEGNWRSTRIENIIEVHPLD